MLAAAMVFSMAARDIRHMRLILGIRLRLSLIPKTVRESSFPVIAAWHPAGPWRGICLWQMDRQEVL